MFGDINHRAACLLPMGRMSYARVYRTVGYAIPSGNGSIKTAGWNAIEADPDELWDPVAQRFNIRRSGVYYVQHHQRTTSQINYEASIYVNGVQREEGNVSGASSYDSVAMGMMLLNAGDYVESYTWRGTAATSQVGIAFSFVILGPFTEIPIKGGA